MDRSEKLTFKEIQSLVGMKEIGKHPDGGGLYFVIPRSGTTYWMLRYTSNKRCKEIPLGHYADLSLKYARFKAAAKQKQNRVGMDPLLAKEWPKLPEHVKTQRSHKTPF